MPQALPKIISPNLLLSLWDRHQKRVKVDLKIALVPSLGGFEKRVFVVVRNNTDRSVGVHMFVWEDTFWYRWIQDRAPRIIPPKPWFVVPPGDIFQTPIPYGPNGFIYPNGKHFGLVFDDDKIKWVRGRRMKRLFAEYRKDFPDWRSHRVGLIFPKCREYGANAAPVRLGLP